MLSPCFYVWKCTAASMHLHGLSLFLQILNGLMMPSDLWTQYMRSHQSHNQFSDWAHKVESTVCSPWIYAWNCTAGSVHILRCELICTNSTWAHGKSCSVNFFHEVILIQQQIQSFVFICIILPWVQPELSLLCSYVWYVVECIVNLCIIIHSDVITHHRYE